MASDGLSQASRSSSWGSFAVGVLFGGSLAAGAAYAGYRVLQAHGTEVASPSRKGESSFRSHRQAKVVWTCSIPHSCIGRYHFEKMGLCCRLST